jgi:hypothetical protein
MMAYDVIQSRSHPQIPAHEATELALLNEVCRSELLCCSYRRLFFVVLQ